MLIFGAALAVAVLTLKGMRARWMAAAAGLLLPFLSMGADVRTPADFALQYAGGALGIAAITVFCRYFARGNYLAYVVIFWLLALRGPMEELLGNPYPAYVLAGRIVAAVALAAILWAIAPAFLPARKQEEAAA